jgi:hypothetical protein
MQPSFELAYYWFQNQSSGSATLPKVVNVLRGYGPRQLVGFQVLVELCFIKMLKVKGLGFI